MKPPPDDEGWEAGTEPADIECVSGERAGEDAEVEADGGGGSDDDEASASRCFDGGGTSAMLNL